MIAHSIGVEPGLFEVSDLPKEEVEEENEQEEVITNNSGLPLVGSLGSCIPLNGF